MFNLFNSSPEKKLKKKREKLLKKAVDIQRSGDLKAYAEIMQEAEDILNEIKALEKK